MRVRNAHSFDAAHVALNLRPSDVEELSAGVPTPVGRDELLEILNDSFDRSSVCQALVDEQDTPLAVLGIAPIDPEHRIGSPWLLATSAFDEVYDRSYHKQTQAWVDALCCSFDYVFNFVHAKNRRSHRWLRSLGFTVEPPQGAFCHFWKGDPSCVTPPQSA